MRSEIIYKYIDNKIHIDKFKFSFEDKVFYGDFTDKFFKMALKGIEIHNNYIEKVKTNKQKELEFMKKHHVFDNTLIRELKALPKSQEHSNRWALVIGVEEYMYTNSISFSKRSAQLFKELAHKRLGVPNSNIYYLENRSATASSIKISIKRLLKNVKEGDTIYFYYNGHGIPDPKKENKAYILASDMDAEFVGDDDFFSLDNIYTTLSQSKAKKVIAIIVDSCFSGGTDGKSLLKGVAAPRLKPKSTQFNKNKMVVLSAGRDTQYSNGYERKGHRLFTYQVIKSILDGNKKIETIYKNAHSTTKEISFKEYGVYECKSRP
jgi:hypothetical protein